MSEHFIGEIVLSGESARKDEFTGFEGLPNKQIVFSLAKKHSKHVELMPYKKEGEPFKLCVNVYLKKNNLDGRFIVALVRDRYPEDIEALKLFVDKALLRLRSDSEWKKEFERESVESAIKELQKLHNSL